ncbi:MAG: DUF3131 domain-containing protein, partial [Gemmatimonadota bacterium]
GDAGDAGDAGARSTEEVAATAGGPGPTEPVAPIARAFAHPDENRVYRESAETAWRYVEAQYQPETGLVNSVIDYPFGTVWDLASTIAAYYAAHELQLLDTEEYHHRTALALETIGDLPLFGGAAFNKNYEVRRAVPAGRNDREMAEGYGWSAIDIGRLLVWLRIISLQFPQHTAAAESIVDRLDLQALVQDGYLWGEDLDSAGVRRRYQEGRLGYEQYAAAGFALWGWTPEHALDMSRHTELMDIHGVGVPTDTRPGGHLTSEPFVLLGLEVGWWSPQWRDSALRVLAVQRARYERTGQITMVTEDAIPLPPHYFYYYTVRYEGENFAVAALGEPAALDGPRWISAKAAHGWHALSPSEYTWRAVEAVLPAGDPEVGWGSGVYESGDEPTAGQNINTAAVILASALYQRERRPLLSAARGRAPARAIDESTSPPPS